MMLLDSNIVIYAAEPGYDALRKFVAEYGPVVSVISKVEVLGYHRLSLENRKKLEIVFQLLPILPLSDEIIDRAISLRQKKEGSLWIPDWLGYFAQICLLSKPEGRRITCCYR